MNNQYQDAINFIQLFTICLNVDPHLGLNNNYKAYVMLVLGKAYIFPTTFRILVMGNTE